MSDGLLFLLVCLRCVFALLVLLTGVVAHVSTTDRCVVPHHPLMIILEFQVLVIDAVLQILLPSLASGKVAHLVCKGGAVVRPAHLLPVVHVPDVFVFAEDVLLLVDGQRLARVDTRLPR